MTEEKNKGGRPKTFRNGRQLVDLFCSFCDCIVENGFTDIPSQTSFCRFLSSHYSDVDRKTIYNSLNKYFPTIKKEFEQLQGDIIAQGAMLGKYNSTMSIFALKNWCKWVDKYENENDFAMKVELGALKEYAQ